MFDSWHQFWAMGGYAPYVWSSYGIAAVVLLANMIIPVIVHRRLLRSIRLGVYDD